MDSNDKFWITIWSILVPSIAITIIAVTFITCKHTQNMADKGYELTPVVGSDYAKWQKAD